MSRVPPAGLVAVIERVRNGLGAVRRKMVPPDIAMMDLVAGMWGFQIVYVIAELGIADDLREHPVDAEELAARRDLDADALYRLLRAATCVGVFKETSGGRFELNSLGETLCTNSAGAAGAFILMMGRMGWSHWGDLLSSVKNGKTAIENSHGMSLFEYLGSTPEIAGVFNEAMTGISAMTVAPVVAAYDFSHAERIVDVGGGHGRLLGGILNEHERSSGILFDLPEVVDGAEPLLRELGILERCERVGGSFFDAGSIPEGDLHVLKSVLHDWSDDDACTILSNLRQAMPSDGRVLLCETVVTAPNRPHLSKLLDIEMLVQAGGRERTEAQYADLFGQTGFRLRRVIPTAAPVSLVEAVPV